MSTQAYDKDGNKIPFAVYKGDIVRGFQTVEQYEATVAEQAQEIVKLNEAIGGHLRHIGNLRAMVGRLKRELYGDGPDIGDNPCPY